MKNIAPNWLILDKKQQIVAYLILPLTASNEHKNHLTKLSL